VDAALALSRFKRRDPCDALAMEGKSRMVFAVISASPRDWLKMTVAAAFVGGLVLAAWAASRR
jgi:hypothetical protein